MAFIGQPDDIHYFPTYLFNFIKKMVMFTINNQPLDNTQFKGQSGFIWALKGISE